MKEVKSLKPVLQAFLFSIVLISCQKTKEVKMEDFYNRILYIEEQIVDLTWFGGLFKFKEFTEIYEHPKLYSKAATECLARPDVTEQQKLIIVLSMQKQSPDKYIEFGKKNTLLFKEGKITERVLKWSVLPTYDWNDLLVRKYKRKEVDELLKDILALNISDDWRSFIEQEVLTGKAKKTARNIR